MTGPRNNGLRFYTTIFLVSCLVGVMLAAIGCNDDETSPVEYPDPIIQPTPYWLYNIWGRDADDIYIIGQPGLIVHYDGSDWTVQDSGTEEKLVGIYGPNQNTTYVCGHNGTLLINRGGSWNTMDPGVEEDLFTIGEYDDEIYTSGFKGTLRRLNGSSWVATPIEIIERDESGTVLVDTTYLDEDVEALTNIFHYGIGGSDGLIITEDIDPNSPFSWMSRTVTGGRDWITSSWSSSNEKSNFWATSSGKLFQLEYTNTNILAWHELYSPSSDGIYGMWMYFTSNSIGHNRWDIFMVSQSGEIIHEVVIDEEQTDPFTSREIIYDADVWLFGIWGYVENPEESDPEALLYNLYVVGIDGTCLHYYDPDETDDVERQWYPESLGLPDNGKNLPCTDKFGRAL